MAALALRDFLQDFGPPPSQAAFEPQREAPQSFGPSAEEEAAAKLAEAVARAEEAAVERVSRIYEDTLQAERDNHASEVAALRAALASEAGSLIASRLDELERQATELTTASVARILGAFASAEMQRRTVERLAALIRDTVRDRDVVRIQVRGPQSLFEPLAAALGGLAEGIDFAESSSLDLGVSIDGSLFETRIAEWSAAFEEAMA